MNIWVSLFELLCDYGSCPYNQELTKCRQLSKEHDLLISQCHDACSNATNNKSNSTGPHEILGLVPTFLITACYMMFWKWILQPRWSCAKTLGRRQSKGHREAYCQLRSMFHSQCKRTKKALSKYSTFAINASGLSQWSQYATRAELLKSEIMTCEETVESNVEFLNGDSNVDWNKLEEMAAAIDALTKNVVEMERVVGELEQARRNELWNSVKSGFQWIFIVTIPFYDESLRKSESEPTENMPPEGINVESDTCREDSETTLEDQKESSEPEKTSSAVVEAPPVDVSEATNVTKVEEETTTSVVQHTDGKKIVTSPTCAYFEQIKERCADQTLTYKLFMDILKDYERTKDSLELVRGVVRLFRKEPFLIEGINEFLPEGYKVDVYENEIAIIMQTVRGEVVEFEFMSLKE